ncbi:MAG: homoserine dehydrogenase [Endomicrobiales bacterium]|nr:homoserine dehydrogenase [Endomicrobiales bacterium]
MKESIKVGIIGFGTVGQGVYKLLEENRKLVESSIGCGFKIAGICDMRPTPPKSLRVRDYRRLIKRDDIDIIVELIGGYEPARTIIIESLESGKNVVTANKAVLVKYWGEIFETARKFSRLVYFEAAVGGAIPVIQGINEGLVANKIESVKGILNGTTNYILSEMTKSRINFDTALSKAQASGFAEADPSYDINGTDTANKLAILSSLAWSCWIKLKDVDTRGIAQISQDDIIFSGRFGYVIKLIGSAKKTREGLELSVEPCLVPKRQALANIDRENNAILIKGDAAGEVMFSGKGAGKFPAASSVVSDIIYLARQAASGTAGIVPYVTYDPASRIQILPESKRKGMYYLRFNTVDKPGVLAKIAGILGKHRISIASVYQEEPLTRRRRGVPIIILTHGATKADLVHALKAIDRLSIIKAKSISFKIES